MKNLVLGAIALSLATCGGAAAPAYAADHNRQEHRADRKEDRRDHRRDDRRDHRRSGIQVRIVTPTPYVYNYPNYSYGTNTRDDRYLSYKYFRSLPSYYANRCDRFRDVIVQDRYTGRYVCMPNYVYERYRLELRFR